MSQLLEELRSGPRCDSLAERFGPAEAREMFLSFKATLTDHPRSVQSELVELFLRDGVVKPPELLELMSNFDETQHAELGRFLGKIVPPCTHLEAFHQCFPHLDHATQRELRARFLQREPEHALMVAPFVDVTRRAMPAVGEATGRRCALGSDEDAPKPMIATRLGDVDNATALLEAGLKLDHWPFGPAVVAYYVEHQPTFLGAFVPRLLEKNLITHAQIEELRQESRSYIYNSSQFYETEEDRAELARITTKVKQLRPHEKYIEEESHKWPVTFEERAEAVMERARLRQAEHVCRAFREIEPCFSDQEARDRYLCKLFDGGMPIIYGMHRAGFGAERIEATCRMIEREGYDVLVSRGIGEIRALCELGLEHIALRGLAKEILGERELTRMLRHVANDLSTLLECFSPENAAKLSALITKTLPSMWCRDLDTMETRGGLGMSGLVAILAADKFSFAENYMRLMGHVRRRAAAGRPTDCTADELKRTALRVLDRDPAMVLRKPFCDQLLDPRDQRRFIREKLQGVPDPDFVAEMVREYGESPLVRSFRDELRSVLKGTPRIVRSIADDWGWSALEPILGPKERLELLCGTLAGSNLAKMTGNHAVVQDLLEHPRYFSRVLNAVEEEANPATLVALYGELRAMCSSGRSAHAPVLAPTSRTRVERALERVRDRIIELCDDDPFLVFNEDLLRVLSAYAAPVVARHAREYLRLNPSFLPVLQRAEVLEPDLAAELVSEHARALILMRDRHGGPSYRRDLLDPEQLEHLRELSPLDRLLGRSTLQRDFYDEALSELEGSPFFDLYRARMVTLAEREQRQNGPRLKVDIHTLNPEFTEMMLRITALELCPFATERRDEIVALPPRAREELIDLIRLSVCYNLDHECAPRIEGAPLDRVRDELHGALAGRMQALFGVKELGSRGMVGFDAELLRAMAIYYDRTCQSDPRLTCVFRELLVHASHGAFDTWRAWGRAEPPADGDARAERLETMKAEGLCPKELTLGQYEEWLQPLSAAIEEELDYNPGQVGSAIRRILAQAMADRHIDPAELDIDQERAQEEYRRVLEPLSTPSARQKELRNEIRAGRRAGTDVSALESEYEQCTQEIQSYLTGHEHEITRCQARLYLARLNGREIGDVRQGRIEVGRRRVQIAELIATLESAYADDHPDFIADIRRIDDALRECHEHQAGLRTVSRSRLSVTDAVDLRAHFLIGERPVPSCQHYDSNGDLNGGLLSYVVDPHVRIIRIYNEEGTIIARSVLRLVEDEAGMPQLFLERLYSTNTHPKVYEAMVAIARRKAAVMNVGLYSHGAESNDDLSAEDAVRTLRCRGSRSAYIYTDAGGGLCERGACTIPGAFAVAGTVSVRSENGTSERKALAE